MRKKTADAAFPTRPVRLLVAQVAGAPTGMPYIKQKP
jgi:hypothetical protein